MGSGVPSDSVRWNSCPNPNKHGPVAVSKVIKNVYDDFWFDVVHAVTVVIPK